MWVALLIIPGVALLLGGAEWLVEGASAIAKRYGVKSLVIGLTVVAFGTSTPELVVSIFSCLKECGDITMGNIIGSNIANILLVLGVASIIFPLNVQHGTVWREIPFALLAVVAMALVVSDVVLDGSDAAFLTRSDGLLLLSFLAIFLYYTFIIRKTEAADPQVVPVHHMPLRRAIPMVVVGIVGLTLGGTWVVDGALAITQLFGVSQALVGITLIAIGTSLPELMTSVVAARKHDVDMAVGNAIGSNIFNVFWILGLSSQIRPIAFSQVLMIDVAVAIGATVLLFFVMFIGKRHRLERSQGIFFVVLYMLYLVFLVWRG